MSQDAFDEKHRLKYTAGNNSGLFNLVAVPPYNPERDEPGNRQQALVDAELLVKALSDIEYGFINRKAVRSLDIAKHAPDLYEDLIAAAPIIAGTSELGMALNLITVADGSKAQPKDAESSRNIKGQLCLIEDQERGVSLIVGNVPLPAMKNNALSYVDINQPDAKRKIDDFIGSCALHRYGEMKLKDYTEAKGGMVEKLMQAYVAVYQPHISSFDRDSSIEDVRRGRVGDEGKNTLGGYIVESYKNPDPESVTTAVFSNTPSKLKFNP